MMMLSANELAVIVIVWVIISFGPFVAKLGISLYRRFFGAPSSNSKTP